MLLRLCSILLLSLCLFNAASALQEIPKLTERVTDLSGILTVEQKNQMSHKLARLEQSKGSQLAVLILPSTQPETIESYSMRVVEQWQLGRKTVDDGVLLLIATADRKLRIEVGYGLEGAIPDLLAKRIIDEHISPAFRQGDFFIGISSGINALEKLIQGETLPEPAFTRSSNSSSSSGLLPIHIIVLFTFIASILKLFLNRYLTLVISAGSAALISYYLSQSIPVAIFAFIFISLFSLGKSHGGTYSSGGGGFSSSGGGFSSSGGGFSGRGGGFGGGGSSGGW